MQAKGMQARRAGLLHGWMWLKQGLWLFKRNPFLWMFLTSILVVGTAGMAMLPILGGFLLAVLFPAFFAGLMLGCHALAEDKELELRHLFSGFQTHGTPLISLGVASMVIKLLLANAVILAGGDALVNQMVAAMQAENADAMLHALSEAGIMFPVYLVLSTVLQTSVFFAAMLIVFRGATPLASLLAAVRATLVNALPLLVYGLMLLPLAALASMPLMLGWLVLLPIIITSQYAIYRDLFPMQKDLQAAAGAGARPDDQPPSA